ncbi:MAG: flagellar basal body P-ring formation chaperone FlgA [Nitrospirota bacterium]
MKKSVGMSIGVILLTVFSFANAGTGNLESLLKAHLDERYPWAAMEIHDIRLNAEKPAGDPSSIVVEQGPPGRTIFALRYPKGKKIIATAQVKVFDSVILSRRPFSKNTVVRKGDVYTTLMETGKITKGAFSSEDDILGKTLTRGIGANVVITDVMVSGVTQVKKGQKVLIVVDAPGFTIKAAGELQQNCAIGEQAKVMNLLSRKIVAGVLINEQTVRVGL